MAPNQPPWPRRWLMTDERLGESLWQAIEALPQGGGIVFRHYSLADAQRAALGREIAGVARARSLVLTIARSRNFADELGAALVHNPEGPGPLPCSMAVHDEAQAAAAWTAGAALVFVGPVHPTRSHPGAPALGLVKAAELAALAGCPAIAQGGMDERRYEELESVFPGAFHGYAGIDCWTVAART